MRKIWLFIILIVAIVCVWRGVWGLLDLYLIPESPDMSFIISVIIGFIILLALGGKKLLSFL